MLSPETKAHRRDDAGVGRNYKAGAQVIGTRAVGIKQDAALTGLRWVRLCRLPRPEPAYRLTDKRLLPLAWLHGAQDGE